MSQTLGRLKTKYTLKLSASFYSSSFFYSSFKNFSLFAVLIFISVAHIFGTLLCFALQFCVRRSANKSGNAKANFSFVFFCAAAAATLVVCSWVSEWMSESFSMYYICEYVCVISSSTTVKYWNIITENEPTNDHFQDTFCKCSRLKSWKENNLYFACIYIIPVQSTVCILGWGDTNGRTPITVSIQYNDIEHFGTKWINWLFCNEYSIVRELECWEFCLLSKCTLSHGETETERNRNSSHWLCVCVCAQWN